MTLPSGSATWAASSPQARDDDLLPAEGLGVEARGDGEITHREEGEGVTGVHGLLRSRTQRYSKAGASSHPRSRLNARRRAYGTTGLSHRLNFSRKGAECLSESSR